MDNTHKHKIPYRKSIGFKLTLGYVLATLIILVLFLLFSLKLIQDNFSHLVQSQFESILGAHENAIEQYFSGPETWAKHLASEQGLKTILKQETLNQSTVQKFLDEHKVVLFEKTFIVLLNKHGRIIYCSRQCDMTGDSLMGVELIRQTAKLRTTQSAVVSVNNEFSFYSVSPVLAAQDLLGFIIVGKKIDDEYVAGIQIEGDIDIAIVRDRAIMASTLKINNMPLIDIPMSYVEYLFLLKKSRTIAEIEFLKQKYFVSAQNIQRMSLGMPGSIMLLKSRAELETMETDLFKGFAWVTVLALIIIGLSSRLIARRVLNPVSQLTAASIEIAHGRKYIKAEVNSEDELGVLATNFNSMLSTIEHQHDVIQKHNDSLEEKVARRTSELHRAMRDLMKLTVAIEHSPVGMIITDSHGVIEYVNPEFTHISGYEKQDSIGNISRILKSDSISKEDEPLPWTQLQSGLSWQGESYSKKKNGTFYWEKLRITPIKDDHDKISNFLISMEDITNIKEYETKLIEQASYDALTQLPNRFLAEDRLRQALRSSDRNGTKGALLFVDLDDFKQVNDNYGHHVGDELLKKVSLYMSQALREEDTVARLGGDEFLVILNSVNSTQDVEKIADKIIALVSQEIIINENSIFVSVSIGISLFPDDSNEKDTLMCNADSAMYTAKEQGKNRFYFFKGKQN